ncbi:hypothetical protein [Streptomyces sp. VRA16 Mangrove soil]|uniref:AbiJ-related protein n=1 Tax=Streptomyces sp. VRA16 Mangrove soil TaxID=2817434 RepID=UPI001A9E04E6|nr:hypothetical protein [Streptomyces sp. VRA16 Mangrove soil]MBO1334607.1 hypothetical protein [Streptomyces sp. VRA16 Mangrove soil]
MSTYSACLWCGLRRQQVRSSSKERCSPSAPVRSPTADVLDAPPSTDSRQPTARTDIIQHRFNNYDGEDDWVFEDPRFGLLDGPDDVLLAFLARLVHPEVRPDADEVPGYRNRRSAEYW